LDEKKKEIKNLKAILNIPHFQLTDSKDLLEAYEDRDKSFSENVSLKETITILLKDIAYLKEDKVNLQEQYLQEVKKIQQNIECNAHLSCLCITYLELYYNRKWWRN